MKIPKPYSLQSKFIIGLLSCIAVISVINLTALYFFVQNTQEKEVYTQASIVLQQADAVQNYVRHTLRPKMFALASGRFIVEAMSTSFISRSVMERTGSFKQDFLYRRVAINARNKDFEANEVELELIAHFRGAPGESLWTGHKVIEGRKMFVMARPVTFAGSCLVCHGEPGNAPVEIGQQYGDHGFHHNLNSIDGVDLVGVPTQAYTAQSNARFALYVAIYLFISFFILFFIFLTFQRVVVVNLRTLSKHFRKNFRDQKGVELLRRVEHGDEMEEMIEGMESLSQHLYETEQQLKHYTAGLEVEVAARTRQIQNESANHKMDLALFVSVLRALKNSANRPQLWGNVLPLLAERFHLAQAHYICTFSTNRSFNWPPDAPPPTLPDDYLDILFVPQLRFLAGQVFIPVGSSNENIEGLLLLQKPAGEVFARKDSELLTALGRQLGIAAENLAAFDSLLRQTQNLQTIFEGIPDPLLLMDANQNVIMANQAALRLTEELSSASAEDNILPHFLQTGGTVPAPAPGTQADPREVTLACGRSFLINTFPLYGDESSSGRYLVAIQEDTDKKRMIRQFVHSEKMATVGKLAAGLAHELNNPLGVILCYAELVRKAVTAPQLQADIDIVIKHTQQAQEVLRDLLNFARPKIATHPETVLGDIAESVMSVFQVQAGKKHVQLACHRHDERALVRIEPQMIEHIMLNLLLNALDALPPEGGRIDVRLRLDRRGRELHLIVEDSGTGIEPEILPSIFDPFFTTKDINKGTGLGLSVIYGYMHEVGGSVEARNRSGGGAVFHLIFPLAAGA